MSLVPLLFRDWWDDFDRERPSRLVDQHFGNVLNREDLSSLVPSSMVRPAGYYRPWRNLINRQNSGTSNISSDSEKVQVVLDVQQFTPNEITVRVLDDTVVVEGKHDEKMDEHGFISRHFIRKYVLPKDAVMSDVSSALSSDGVLTITAPKKSGKDPAAGRVVTIIQTGAPAIKPNQETNVKIEQAN
uniref:Protein lethal(2)essential for life n=1 Tax=Lygus hesperus TaxID=30085 RepID=A0A0A9ZAB5_LYGHE